MLIAFCNGAGGTGLLSHNECPANSLSSQMNCISQKVVTIVVTTDQFKFHDDGRYRPKHVGANVKYFSVKIVIFYTVNKKCICWKNNFEKF